MHVQADAFYCSDSDTAPINIAMVTNSHLLAPTNRLNMTAEPKKKKKNYYSDNIELYSMYLHILVCITKQGHTINWLKAFLVYQQGTHLLDGENFWINDNNSALLKWNLF